MTMSLDYVAGLFDGEGWCSIKRAPASRTRGRREWAYQCGIELTMRELSILLQFQKIFGGTVNPVKSRSENHSPYFHWRVGGNKALVFANVIRDKSWAKHDQLELIQRFQSAKNYQGNRPLSDETYNFYVSCFDRMKQLNMKGQGKV